MHVRDVMSAPTVIVPTVTPAQEAARHLDYSGVGCLIVADGEKAVGIVTDRDLALRVLGRGLPGSTRVGEVMSRNLVTVGPDEDVDVIAVLFRKHALRRLPVVDDGVVVGMVTIDDLLLHTHQVVDDLLAPVAAEILEPQHALQPAG
jgi:CBS domain-containing protein